MNIVVCIKQVPDPEIPTSQFKVDEAAKAVVPPPGVAPVISTFDLHAIEAAVQLKEAHGGQVTVLSLGASTVRDALKRAIAMGCDAAVQLEDPAFEGGDSFAAATVLAALAELLGVSGAVPVQKVEVRDGELYVERVTEDGYQPITMPMPSVLGI